MANFSLKQDKEKKDTRQRYREFIREHLPALTVGSVMTLLLFAIAFVLPMVLFNSPEWAVSLAGNNQFFTFCINTILAHPVMFMSISITFYSLGLRVALSTIRRFIRATR